MDKNILGIDPGLNGAIALVANEIKASGFFEYKPENTDAIIVIHDIDDNITQVKSKIENWKLLYGIDGVVIEKVCAYPGQGVTSAFSFGEIAGQLKGICLGLGIPILAEPRPQDWKKKVGITLNPPRKPKRPLITGSMDMNISAKLMIDYEIDCRNYQSAVSTYKREQKNVSRNRAAELYPSIAGELSRVKDADRAEAILLAHYGGML